MLLPFESCLEQATFIKRYKRFLADVKMDNKEIVTVHCANSGSMRSCLNAGGNVWIEKSPNANRKLPYTLQLMELEDGLACVNTQKANQFMQRFFSVWLTQPQLLPIQVQIFCNQHFKQWQHVHSEYPISKHTRFDFCLAHTEKKVAFEKALSGLCLIEVKSVSLYENGQYMFPDAVTERGLKHAQELQHMASLGHTAWLIFVLMRGHATHQPSFCLAKHIDPAYAAAVQQAAQAGVHVACVQTQIDVHGIDVTDVRLLSETELRLDPVQ